MTVLHAVSTRKSGGTSGEVSIALDRPPRRARLRVARGPRRAARGVCPRSCRPSEAFLRVEGAPVVAVLGQVPPPARIDRRPTTPRPRADLRHPRVRQPPRGDRHRRHRRDRHGTRRTSTLDTRAVRLTNRAPPRTAAASTSAVTARPKSRRYYGGSTIDMCSTGEKGVLVNVEVSPWQRACTKSSSDSVLAPSHGRRRQQPRSRKQRRAFETCDSVVKG
jgi:hypothetical protein